MNTMMTHLRNIAVTALLLLVGINLKAQTEIHSMYIGEIVGAWKK